MFYDWWDHFVCRLGLTRSWAIIGAVEDDRLSNAHFRKLIAMSPLGDVARGACIHNSYTPVTKKHSRSLSNACRILTGKLLNFVQLLNCNPGSVSSCRKSVMSMANRLSFL